MHVARCLSPDRDVPATTSGSGGEGDLAAGERKHGPEGAGRVPVRALQANRSGLSRATTGTWDARIDFSIFRCPCGWLYTGLFAPVPVRHLFGYSAYKFSHVTDLSGGSQARQAPP